MAITKKNHYNPCFWTAFWNSAYLDSKRNREHRKIKPREQEIFCLNLKCNKILKEKTKNIFYEKAAGIAYITKEDALDYCKRIFPEKYDELKLYYKEHSSDLILDFENHFTGFENSYKLSLEKAIIQREIENISEKTILSFFIFIQIARNHNHLAEVVSVFQANNMAKFEMLIDLKDIIANRKSLMKLILPFVSSRWKLYRTKEEKFPLSDNPVLIRPFHIYLPLAPDLLLEIDFKRSASEHQICSIYEKISFLQYKEFKKRTIENSSREIIFGSQGLLKKWQKSGLFKRHIKQIKALSNNK